ncbi:hypothetical protein Q1695_009939 [Nippostrongylus brasiliensis]|nr:hypothetical protein Q1695_009939 [Nippostrongylus brasiliensis]
MVRPIFRRKSRYLALFTIAIITLFYLNEPQMAWLIPKEADIDTYDLSMGKEKQLPLRQDKHAKLKVIVVPFTHTDPGWLNTFDVYSKETDDTLDAMHTFMMSHQDMRFMWAETVFLERWWRKQNDSVKNDVRRLVKEKRLDLVTGSWVMTDEANPYYPVSVDNIIEGFHFIVDEFGVKPSLLFTLDPFGHSNSIAYLYSEAGVHREVINRISRETKEFLHANQAHRFQWKQYFDNSGRNAMRTHLLPYSHYDIPSSCGPSWGTCCQIDIWRFHKKYSCPGVKPITKENVKDLANQLVDQLKQLSETYVSNVVMMMFGDDFRFTTLFEWQVQYEALRLLFDEINQRKDMEISFGTITDFFEQMESWYKTNKKQLHTLSGDFFPYESWTGYFSTRPFFKAQERRLHRLLRAADLLSAQAGRNLPDKTIVSQNLQQARRALLLFQHHDAITGTSKKSVMQDYSQQLHSGTLLTSTVIESAVTAISQSGKVENVEYYESNTKTTALKTLEVGDRTIVLRVVNTLPYQLHDVVSVRVKSVEIAVSDEDGKPVESQIEPYVKNGRIDKATFLVSFRARLRPLDISTYTLKHGTGKEAAVIASIKTSSNFTTKIGNSTSSHFKVEQLAPKAFAMKGGTIATVHNATTGMLQGVTLKSSKLFELRPEFLVYGSHNGAYEMNVYGSFSDFFAVHPIEMFFYVGGPVQETTHIFARGLYNGLTLKKVDGVLGEQLNFDLHVDVMFKENSEVSFGLQVSESYKDFYTDSLGIQLLRRKQNKFFPMPSSAVLENGDHRVTLSSNVPHACRLVRGSTIETIIERSIHSDDGHGLGVQADSIADDNLPVDMKFTVLVEELLKDMTDFSRYTVHTPGGHLSVQNTIYSPVVLYGPKISATSPHTSVPPAPCDLQLVNVRLLPNGKHLLTIFGNGMRSTETRSECGSDVQSFLRAYLKTLGVKSVQQTDVSGIDRIGAKFAADDYKPYLEPFKFLSLVLTF